MSTTQTTTEAATETSAATATKEPTVDTPKASANALPGSTSAEAAVQLQQARAAWAEQTNPSKITYYPYAEVTRGATKLTAYTGKPVTVGVDDPQPENTSKWQPATCGDGALAYYADDAWHVGSDITTMSLAAMQALALASATRSFGAAVEGLTSKYSAAEQKSWSIQVEAARDVLATGATADSLLSVLAKTRGVDVKALAQKIVDKANAYQAAYMQILATFQAARDAIGAAKAVDDLPALTIDDVSLLNYVALATS